MPSPCRETCKLGVWEPANRIHLIGWGAIPIPGQVDQTNMMK